MKQAELNRAVAHATGESLSTIKRLGFLLAPEVEACDPEDGELGPYVIDWDEVEAQRQMAMSGSSSDEPAVA